MAGSSVSGRLISASGIDGGWSFVNIANLLGRDGLALVSGADCPSAVSECRRGARGRPRTGIYRRYAERAQRLLPGQEAMAEDGRAVVERLWSEVFGASTRVGATASGPAPPADLQGGGSCCSWVGDGWARHSLQTRAIALSLARAGLLRPPAAGLLTTVEFGAADAELSKQVADATAGAVAVAGGAGGAGAGGAGGSGGGAEPVHLRQILVDRVPGPCSGAAFDEYAASTGTGACSDGPSTEPERLTIDIADLDLPSVLGVAAAPGGTVIGMAKHLCGAGTDLAVRAMLSVAEAHPTAELSVGVAIVGCCHELCEWRSCSQASQEFFASHGIMPEDQRDGGGSGGGGGFQLLCEAAGSTAAIYRQITAAAAAAASEVAAVLGEADTESVALAAERAAALAISEAIQQASGAEPLEKSDDLAEAAAVVPMGVSRGEVAEIALAAARGVAASQADALRVALKARRLLDESRRRALIDAGFEATLSVIVSSAVSVDNTLLLAHRPAAAATGD